MLWRAKARLRRSPRTVGGQVTKGYGSSWIFELRLTWANALQLVQRSAFSLVTPLIGARCLWTPLLHFGQPPSRGDHHGLGRLRDTTCDAPASAIVANPSRGHHVQA
jgi:hypothetical protein